jgi:hypothetical protein
MTLQRRTGIAKGGEPGEGGRSAKTKHQRGICIYDGLRCLFACGPFQSIYGERGKMSRTRCSPILAERQV